MISLEAFVEAIGSVLDRRLNDPQMACVGQPTSPALMIVAGPGSGKTTALVLRALRHVLVDGLAPDSVVITTFTRKGAGEISSRLIGWGLKLIDHFLVSARTRGELAEVTWLNALDVNAIQTGTFDSFCQEWLGKSRRVGQPAPVMLEQFAADFVYRRKVFNPSYRSGGQAALDPFLSAFNFEGQAIRNQTEAGNLSIDVNHRLLQDLVDVQAFGKSDPSRLAQVNLLAQYRKHLLDQQLFDFPLCADRILSGLRSEGLYDSITPIRALLVDEYQDTNPLQEAIYFELVRQSGCAFAVVGDDDQALYRFRGATVELFTNFQQRFSAQLSGAASVKIYLVTNHRSTPEIVKFFNSFATHDPAFVAARVAGKPAIEKFNESRGIPILGMFRDSMDDLAADLTSLLADVFQGAGRALPNTTAVLRGSQERGALGDAVMLTSSAREFKPGAAGPQECLPMQMRRHLEAAGLGVFNPRGQDLRDLPNVQRLLGLVLLCIDPSDCADADMPLTRDPRDYIPQWRQAAQTFITTNPSPHSSKGSLRQYVDGWRRKRASSGAWPDEIPLLDLLYKLITWMPEFQRDPEHQVYLEAIMRCVVQGAHYSSYGFQILDKSPHDVRSRGVIFTDLMQPIADKTIDINEDLLFAIPRNRLGIMTIHQSKGLEYPLVIVDVGSEFKISHAKQAFKRFPRIASSNVEMESDFAPFTQVGPLRTARSGEDRTFDDLMRLYYVAFSRAQVALLLVGLTKSIEYAKPVQNIATFWTRNGTWSWRKDNPPQKKNTPTQADLLPLTLI